MCGVNVVTLVSAHSSIINIPGESTLRRDFLRLQLANKERSEALRRQQLEQQQNDEHKRQLLAERQKRIEEQKEQRRRLEEVRSKTVNIGVRVEEMEEREGGGGNSAKDLFSLQGKNKTALKTLRE